jgi:ribosomal protein S6
LRNYEIITIFQDRGDLESCKKSLKDILTRHQVQIEKEDDWGSKKMPHELKKRNTGHFFYCTCKMDPLKIKEVNHDARLQQDILDIMVKALA